MRGLPYPDARRYATVDTATGALAELFTTGRPGAPVIAPLGGGELLLLKDSVGLAVGADGRPARRPPLNWSDAPAAVAVSAPYAPPPAGLRRCGVRAGTRLVALALRIAHREA